MRRVLIVGSEGQDGRILQERLKGEGCELICLGRGSTRSSPDRALQHVDVLDAQAVLNLVGDFRPDEAYYLAAVHHSAEDRALLGGQELYRASHGVHVEGLLNVLEAIRWRSPSTRLFYAASCLVFGEPETDRQDESTPLAPVCIYGITKTTGIHCCRFYSRSHAVHASVGILYNHESPYRRPDFLSRRIVQGAVDIRRGRSKTLVLGDLSARNDWGWAGDKVDAMTRIARVHPPDDFVVATGEARTVLDFVRAVFERAGLDWRKHVEEQPSRIARRRGTLIGDSSRLRSRTGWKPTVGFEEMCGLLWEEGWAQARSERSH